MKRKLQTLNMPNYRGFNTSLASNTNCHGCLCLLYSVCPAIFAFSTCILLWEFISNTTITLHDYRHINYHRSITSEAIAMVANDNEPIITPSSVQETIDNQLKVE